MYTELIIGNEVYKLKLTTRTSILLEKTLGYNPITLLMDIERNKMPKLNDMLIILHASLQHLQHGINMDKVYDLFDAYVADGHSLMDLLPVFIDVFKQSGYIAQDTEETSDEEKN